MAMKHISNKISIIKFATRFTINTISKYKNFPQSSLTATYVNIFLVKYVFRLGLYYIILSNLPFVVPSTSTD